MTEAQFMANILSVARMCGWLVYHTHDSRRSEPGFPDLVLVHTGRCLFRELKTEKGKLTAEQQKWIGALASSGADVGVWIPSQMQEIADLLAEPNRTKGTE